MTPDAFAAVPAENRDLFIDELPRAGAGVKPASADARCAIQFLPANTLPDRYPIPEGEGYVIRITPEVINVHAAAPAGHFYGLQTLTQIIEAAPKADGKPLTIACRVIAMMRP